MLWWLYFECLITAGGRSHGLYIFVKIWFSWISNFVLQAALTSLATFSHPAYILVTYTWHHDCLLQVDCPLKSQATWCHFILDSLTRRSRLIWKIDGLVKNCNISNMLAIPTHRLGHGQHLNLKVSSQGSHRRYYGTKSSVCIQHTSCIPTLDAKNLPPTSSFSIKITGPGLFQPHGAIS